MECHYDSRLCPCVLARCCPDWLAHVAETDAEREARFIRRSGTAIRSEHPAERGDTRHDPASNADDASEAGIQGPAEDPRGP